LLLREVGRTPIVRVVDGKGTKKYCGVENKKKSDVETK